MPLLCTPISPCPCVSTPSPCSSRRSIGTYQVLSLPSSDALPMYPSRSHNPMADCLSRIRNASFRYFEEITVIYSRPVHDLLDQLCDGGYISSYHVYEETGSSQATPRMIQVTLKYHNNRPAIQGIQQISSPSKRMYLSKKRLRQLSQQNNWGETRTLFVLTSQGIQNHREILSSSQPMHGGEPICLIW